MLPLQNAVSYIGVGSEPPGVSPGIDTASFYGSFVQVIITLLVIVGIIVLLIRFLARKNKIWSGQRSMRVLGGVTLGQNKSMQVVEIGGVVYVVGVGENITLLDKISDGELAESFLLSLEGTASSGRPEFAGQLTRWISGLRRIKQQSPSDTEELDSSDAFRDLLQSKMKRMSTRKEALREWMDDEDSQRR